MELHVSLKRDGNSYDIIIEPGCIENIRGIEIADSYAIITDSNVRKLYADKLLENLNTKTEIFEFKAGETQKIRETKARLEDEMHANGFSRDSCIIALGGGVVGDVAGFVAATFNRGIPYMQVPTTLLAQVDSSVGGKVGVNTPHGKNLIGAFYQPKKVYIDPDTLSTLPEREIKNGLAEIIKYGVIYDKDLFEFLENNIEKIMDSEILTKVISRCCEIKAEIVSKDEKEENFRLILNYGHTIGHAVEACSNYSYTHGEAISIGMALAGKIAVNKGFLEPDEFERQNKLIEKAGLPIKAQSNVDELIEAMHLDKKRKNNEIMFVLSERIGSMKEIGNQFRIPVSEEEIREILE